MALTWRPGDLSRARIAGARRLRRGRRLPAPVSVAITGIAREDVPGILDRLAKIGQSKPSSEPAETSDGDRFSGLELEP